MVPEVLLELDHLQGRGRGGAALVAVPDSGPGHGLLTVVDGHNAVADGNRELQGQIDQAAGAFAGGAMTATWRSAA